MLVVVGGLLHSLSDDSYWYLIKKRYGIGVIACMGSRGVVVDDDESYNAFLPIECGFVN